MLKQSFSLDSTFYSDTAVAEALEAFSGAIEGIEFTRTSSGVEITGPTASEIETAFLELSTYCISLSND